MGKNFIRWNDYYKKTFSDAYHTALDYRVQNEAGNASQDSAFEIYKNLLLKSIELLKFYLHNNGLFQFDMYEVVRECYYINFLNDGEEWITLLNLYNLVKKDSKQTNKDLFISWTSGNFEIFDHLDDNFNKMVAMNE